MKPAENQGNQIMNTTARIAAAAVAIVAGLTQLASVARAQDFNAMNDAFNAQLNAAMNGTMNNIMDTNMNDPRIQQMYLQAVQSGQFQGSLADYAYAYAYTGGFSNIGYQNAMNTNNQIAAQNSQMMNDYFTSQQAYKDAYNGWTGGYAANQWEGGLGLMGQNTYNSNWGQQQLPHTWQPGTYDYNGNSYYVDQSGQYYMADPYNPGYYAPMW